MHEIIRIELLDAIHNLNSFVWEDKRIETYLLLSKIWSFEKKIPEVSF